ncbi:MAG: short chain dehydrogenase [Leptospiraceae bacterium]|nr:MAG: short chain dehydrogenase [Leptospiraceae bacterium]
MNNIVSYLIIIDENINCIFKNLMNLFQKRIIITGATGGLGKALIKELIPYKVQLGLIDINETELKKLSKELLKQKIKNEIYVCDISKKEQCKEAVHFFINKFNCIDILINNAGITHRSLFKETNLEVIEKIIHVNLMGSIYCTKFCLEEITKNQGTIVIISSISGFAPLYGRTGYAASKHGLSGFFKSLRTELKDFNVNILIVYPWFIRTNIDKNALANDGSPAKTQWSTIGKIYPPEFVAKKIINGIIKNKKEIIISASGKLAYLLNFLFPSLYEDIMKNKIQKEFL